MSEKHTITINGTHYDAHTGLPVSAANTPHAPEVAARQSANAATVHHRTVQKSHTLNRKTVKKHAPVKKPQQLDGINRQRVAHTQSAAISKFAPKPIVKDLDVAPAPAQPHPVVTRVHTKQAAATTPVTPQHVPAPVKQQAALEKALSTATKHESKKSRKRLMRTPKALNIASASLAIVVLAGYFTYLNIPTISVRVAAAQAGINASYPDYRPAGYRLDGPIAYDNGQVSIKFAATTGAQNFTIDQQQTNWDSSALLENYVAKQADANYVPHQKGGLTVYTFGNDAAWVNGGILYTISGNSQLSDDQVLRIATSM